MSILEHHLKWIVTIAATVRSHELTATFVLIYSLCEVLFCSLKIGLIVRAASIDATVGIIAFLLELYIAI